MTTETGRPAGRLGALAGRVGGLAGWRRALAALAFGVAAAGALPPLFVIPALAVGFAGLVWLLDGAGGARRAFADGWLFGAGYFAAGLYWIANALLVEAARFAWMIPLAVLGLSFALAVFAGLATLAVRLSRASGMTRVGALAAAWAASEWLRGRLFTGFPWNPVGSAWTAVEPVLQTAAWTGVYGLSAVTVFAAAAFAELAAPGLRRRIAAFSGVVVLALFGALGAARLADAPAAEVDGVRLRIVQPGIAQRAKIRGDLKLAAFRHLAAMSRGGGGATHVIWPEDAVPFRMLTDRRHRALLRTAVPAGGLLVTGATRWRRGQGRPAAVFNSVVAVDRDGAVAGIYDKHRLVPFGEYVPLRGALPIDKLTPGRIDFTPGPGARTLSVAGLPPFSPLICYEVVFPAAATGPGRRPGWLLNVSNDAWFGRSAGPHQHFAAARMRAVEEGLPMVRAANTGISGIADAYGRVLRRLDLGTRGVIEAPLPAPAARPTVYARVGDAAAAVLAVLLFGGGLAMQRFAGDPAPPAPRRTGRPGVPPGGGSAKMRGKHLFTSESVSEGHPDKVADRISDEVVDAYLAADPGSRVGCETLTTTDRIVVAGEVRGPDSVTPARIEELARAAVRDIGYEQDGFHWRTARFRCHLHAQSADIAIGVDAAGNKAEGAGDQGLMFGYACRETDALMPAPLHYSHRILQSLAEARRAGRAEGLGPDSKSQVTLEYEDGVPVRAASVVVSTQHHPDLGCRAVREIVRPHVEAALPAGWMCDEGNFHVNPTGRFVTGGPHGDCGLTGRKIIVDTYGGAAPHGGGAFSGKDPSKVDRSAAYAVRWIAKNVVAAGLAERCVIQISYAIGLSRPLSVHVDTGGTGQVEDRRLAEVIWCGGVVDLTPRGIRERLALDRPIYARTSAYGHFGREPDGDGGFSWERTDLVDDLVAALA